MNIDKNEATLALAAIDAAGARSTQLQRYRRFAPFLILWGVIWLLANTVSDLAADLAGIAWPALTRLAPSPAAGWAGASTPWLPAAVPLARAWTRAGAGCCASSWPSRSR